MVVDGAYWFRAVGPMVLWRRFFEVLSFSEVKASHEGGGIFGAFRML